MMRLAITLLLAGAGCGDSTFDVDGGDLVPLGAAYVNKRGCHKCHDGERGSMAGSVHPLPSTSAYPSNLTSDVATGLGGWADLEIIRAIRYGYDNQNQALCPPMTHLADSSDACSLTAFDDMDDLEARSIVAYLRSLRPVSRPDVPSSSCPPIKPEPACGFGSCPMMTCVDMAGLDLSVAPVEDLARGSDGA
jgi:hypothetical protein